MIKQLKRFYYSLIGEIVNQSFMTPEERIKKLEKELRDIAKR
jgi:hypothetical protein